MPEMHPALPLILGGLLIPVLTCSLRRLVLVVAPLLGLFNLVGMSPDQSCSFVIAEFRLDFLRIDKLSMLFGYLFHIAAFLAAVYSLHLKEKIQPATGLLYAGSAVGLYMPVI